MHNIKKATDALKSADAVIIGASNGLSIAEGFNIFATNEWFMENFGDLASRYGLRNVLEAMFFRFPTIEEQWDFWARLASLKLYGEPVSKVMHDLREIVGDKPSFVLTTNVEGHFIPAGFLEEAVFEMEGSIGEMVCSAGCADEPVSNEAAIETIMRDGATSATIPTCPNCGAPMMLNTGSDQSFFNRPSWQSKAKDFQSFIAEHQGQKIVILELGVGDRNPLVKGTLSQVAETEPDVTYVVANMTMPRLPRAIAEHSIFLQGDIARTLEDLAQEL